MTRYEYQIVEWKLEKGENRYRELVRILNHFGQEGWRLHEFKVHPVRASNEKSFRLLLERRIDPESSKSA